MKKYLAILSLMFTLTFITLVFFIPRALDPLPGSWDVLLLLFLLLGAFLTSIFSVNGKLKTVSLVTSFIGMLIIASIFVIVLAMTLFGNFGT